jgi:hypothetical protein
MRCSSGNHRGDFVPWALRCPEDTTNARAFGPIIARCDAVRFVDILAAVMFESNCSLGCP